MSDTFTQIFIHFVFSTKNREPFLTESRLREAVHGYIATIARDRGCNVYGVNGWFDHVHVLLDMPPTIAAADLTRDLKANSSRIIRNTHGVAAFAWQVGYSAFSVSRRNVPDAVKYIETQEEHHGKRKVPGEVELQWLEGRHDD